MIITYPALGEVTRRHSCGDTHVNDLGNTAAATHVNELRHTSITYNLRLTHLWRVSYDLV